jgi:hypothetical protein
MPIAHGRTINVLSDIDEAGLLDAGPQRRGDLIEVSRPEGVADIPGDEEQVRPGHSGAGVRDAVVVAEEHRTDLSQLDVTVSGAAEDAVHLADGGGPVGDTAREETAVDDIETCVGVL